MILENFHGKEILAHFIISENDFKYLGFKKGANSGDKICC